MANFLVILIFLKKLLRKVGDCTSLRIPCLKFEKFIGDRFAVIAILGSQTEKAFLRLAGWTTWNNVSM